jgi:hypothetical protein
MSNETTLRDKLAMSMPFEAIPVLNNEETIKIVSEKLKIKWSEDPFVQIEWAMQYQAAIRYMYADAMLNKC